MSHVTTIDLEVRDLDALDAACRRLGLELARGQTTYRWYGHYLGDTPLPEGFGVEDLGHCEHAIRVPGDGTAYEIGVASRRDGRLGYTLLYDNWRGGAGMCHYVGDEQCGKLKQAYGIEVARRQAQVQGFQVQEQPQQDGSVRLQMTKV